MPYSVQFNADLQAVESTFAGVVTADEIQAEMAESFVLAIAQDCNRYLADLREAQVRISVFAISQLPDEFEEMGGMRPIRVAIIQPAEKKSREVVDFYKIFGLNRGWTVQTFDERAHAVAWLGG